MRGGIKRQVSTGRKAPKGEAPPAAPTGMGLYTTDGARKYLTAGEHDSFLRAAERADREVRTLCLPLAYGGCRLAEALALTADRVDLAAGVLVFESVKKRRSGVYRAAPVPPSVLDLVHGCPATKKVVAATSLETTISAEFPIGDDGTTDHGNVEYGGGDACCCPQCGYAGFVRAADFCTIPYSRIS